MMTPVFFCFDACMCAAEAIELVVASLFVIRLGTGNRSRSPGRSVV